MAGRVQGKMVLVTGAAQGLGAAHASLLAREGARVLCTDINGAGAEDTASRINAEVGAGHAIGIQHDVTDPTHWERAIEIAENELGGLNVLVHPITGDELRDHRDWALWLGQSRPLDLSVLDAEQD